VSSYQTGGSEGAGDVPFDSVALNFAKVEVEYKPQKPDGSAGAPERFGWDLKANKSY
jgi:type VI secretion system secreted protein Hcp